MADLVNFNVSDDVTLARLLQEAEKFEALPFNQLSPDQQALLQLKQVLEVKASTPPPQHRPLGAACFMCVSGA